MKRYRTEDYHVNQYHAFIYNYEYEIEHLNKLAKANDNSFYTQYWDDIDTDDAAQLASRAEIKEAIKAIVLQHVSLQNDYLPEDEDFEILDLEEQVSILNQAVYDFFDDGLIEVHRINRDSNLYQWLLDWYGWTDQNTRDSLKVEQNMYQYISDAYIDGQYLYFTTVRNDKTGGTNLLGGDNDRQSERAFLDFLNNQPNPDIITIRKPFLVE